MENFIYISYLYNLYRCILSFGGCGMDLRKVIEFGRGSHVITIPKAWFNKNKLKKGDLLDVSVGLNEITYSTKSSNYEKKPLDVSITAIDKDMNHIESEIVSSYLNNADSIEVISRDLKTNAPQIKSILRNLSGMEILEQTSTRIVAKNLINTNEISILSLIRRMDIITRGMMEDGIKCFSEDHYESIRSRDKDVNRLFFLSSRVIRSGLKDHHVAQQLKTTPVELQDQLLVIMRIEKIADHQKRIARELSNGKIPSKIKKSLISMYIEIKNKFEDVMKAYYTKNKKIAIDIEVSNYDRIQKLNLIQAMNHQPNCTRIVEQLKGATAQIRNLAKTILTIG